MERVLIEVDAGMQGAGGLGQGKLRLTTERLVFERKKMFGGAGDVTSLPLSNIQSAGISGLMDKKLKVRAGSTEYVLTAGVGALGNKDRELKEISDRLQRSLAGQSLGTATQSQSSAPRRSSHRFAERRMARRTRTPLQAARGRRAHR